MTNIALGVTTFNRPEFLEKNLKAIVKNLDGVVDHIYVHDDGSDSKHKGAYARAFKPLGNNATLQIDSVNNGVAHSKNALLRAMLDDGAEWLFLCEDDIKVVSSKAITGYIDACKESGIHHLSFAHHGPANAGGPVEVNEPVAYYPHSIGAWTVFSRKCLEEVGLFDEHFICAWEHVEHEMRLIQAGFCGEGASAFKFPDANGSENWLTELPGSIEKSSIRPRDDWQRNIRTGLAYWRDNLPDTFKPMFGDGSFLHNYANSILGVQPS